MHNLRSIVGLESYPLIVLVFSWRDDVMIVFILLASKQIYYYKANPIVAKHEYRCFQKKMQKCRNATFSLYGDF